MISGSIPEGFLRYNVFEQANLFYEQIIIL